MKLDPEIAAFFPAPAPGTPPPPVPSPPQLREGHRQIAAAFNSFLRPLAEIRDLEIPGPAGPLRARLYTPVAGDSLPLSVFLHGGGWLSGDLDTHELLCRDLALGAGCKILAIDYRLAPEHRFPSAVDDCLAACTWVLDHARELGADPRRIAIGGDSAGGNLAAVTVQALKQRDGARPMFQWLAYPATDFRLLTPAYTELAEAPGLTTRDVKLCREHYLRGDADQLDPRASPILAADLSGTPETLIITAELDPLRDDGEAYAARLIAAGVDVRCRRYLGLPHSFLSLPPVIQRRQAALAEVCGVLREVFARHAASRG